MHACSCFSVLSNYMQNVGKSVLAGLLNLDASVYLKPKPLPFDADKKRAIKFTQQWSKFDWTAELDA